jgi:cardiolipin synthase (CMP-forming)
MGWPNRITLGRLLAIGPFVVCLLNLDEPDRVWLRWVAIIIFALMGLSDLVDGYLARLLKDESPLGAFLDPLADKLFITFSVIILCVKGIHYRDSFGADVVLTLPNWVAVAAISKDLVVSIGFGVIYLITGRVFIQPRRLGKWCTTIQLALVLSVLLWPSLPQQLGRLPEVLWYAATAMAILATLDYIRLGSRFLSATAADAKAHGKGE